MKYKLIWTEIFVDQLRKILLYLIDNFSYQAAAKYRKFLDEQITTLQVLPYRGKEIELVGLKKCLYLISKKNIIFYRVDEEKKEVHLLFIASANENYLNLL